MPTANFISENWQYLTALIAGAFAFWRFLISRGDELAWRRTEFLFDQARYLESDPDMREMLQVLGDNHNDATIHDILGDDSALDKEEKFRLRNSLDHFLNVFDRIYYAYATAKTLSKDEVKFFEWYLFEISENVELAKHCNDSGFQDVLKLANLLKRDS